MQQTTQPERPLGITIIAVLAAIAGILFRPEVKAAFGRS